MAPTKNEIALLKEIAKSEEEACIMRWLELFKCVDTKASAPASEHFGWCEHCKDMIVQAERELDIGAGKVKRSWLVRASIVAGRHGPLKCEDRKKILDGLASRIALSAQRAKPVERKVASC